MAHAQVTWVTAGLPGFPYNIQQVVGNTAHDAVYYGGSVALGGNWQQTNAVLRYSAGQWDTLGTVNDMINTMIEYHDTLLVSGVIFYVNGTVPVEGIAYHDAQGWHPYGSLAPYGARRLRILDDTLYAVGTFDHCDGVSCTGVAKRTGGHWEPVGQISGGYIVIDIVRYNDELVIIGGLDINGVGGIAHLVNGQWQGLGQGILGGLSGPHSVAVFQGDLYVGGQISLGAGNPGQDIMRWDGSSFHPLGLGLQRELGNFSSFSDASVMQVHDGRLFVGGGFNYAGGVEAHGVASWDGTRWCGVAGDLVSVYNGGVYGMDFYGDTLFVTCGDSVDGVFVNKAAKFIGTSYEDTCSAPVGIAEHEPSTGGAVIHMIGPDQFVMDGLPMGKQTVRVFDASGRLVLEQVKMTDGTTDATFALPHCASGVYAVQVPGWLNAKVLVQH
ncbi:MAG: hypothetical protein IPI81_13175 [Flavobacteriales bacterium]|nr:hypothetical protein [Flavobacteriales bacterium]MCC6938508.1 hypothetical protein [Flavobacteriales bacterium]